MLVPLAGVGYRTPLVTFLPPSGSRCAAEASSHQVTGLGGGQEADLPDAAWSAAAGRCVRTIAPRLLIIHDNEGTLRTLALWFRRGGFEVTEVMSGAAGLALARAGGLHAIVADQCLPDLTGLEMLAQLRALGSSVPVVMMSGWPTPELRARAEELGACAFLAKPVRADDLLDMLQRAVQTEVQPVDHEVVGQSEPASQAMSEIRQFVAEVAGRGAPGPTAAAEATVAVEAHRRLLHKLIQVVARPNLSVHELLAGAEAIRRVARARDYVSPPELARSVLDALCGLPDVRRPLHAKITQALAHLASLEGEDLGLSETDLAEVIGTSPSRLSRLLRPQTGLDLRQWKRGFRMRQAVQQLAGTDKDVSQIAAWLGCKYVSRFDDDFHDLFGLTPREFRKALRASSAPR